MEQIIIPTTARQAFAILDALVTQEEKTAMCAMSKSDFLCQEHFGLGLWIRNNWIYGPETEGEKEQELRNACYRMLCGGESEDCFISHPDTISGQFLERYYRHLKRTCRK